MKKKLLMHVAWALCCLVGVANAQDGTIGVYMDTAGSSCTGTTTAGVLQGSVWVNLAGATAGGITGAEFRVDYGNRDNLTINFTRDSAVDIMLGDPFEDLGNNFFLDYSIGANMAFSSCQTGRVLLGMFTVIEDVTPVSETWFTVRKKYEPSNSIMDCAMVTLCDGPVFTKVCVSPADSDHWRAVLNPGTGTTADCNPVAVAQSSWSQVKEIFRN